VAERIGDVDGFLIDCFVDPGLEAARELSPLAPVIGAGQASLACATLLGERISIITVVEPVALMIRRRALRHGMQGHLTRPRYIDVPVLATTNRQRLVELISDEAKEAVKQEGADVVLLGCTGFRSLAQDVSARLNGMLARHVPVLDSAITALKMLETIVGLGLSHSKIAFPLPPQKIRTFPR
jgi:allantoin racemase